MEDSTLLKKECKPEILTDYCVVDIETTGMSHVNNEIIEISALKIRDGMIANSFSSLVKPVRGVNYFITRLTGISNKMLSDAATIDEVLPDFLSFIGNDVILGHNIKFDLRFLRANCEKYLNIQLENESVDTLGLARKYSGAPSCKLDSLAEFYGVNSSGHHRALRDCEMTYEIYKKMFRQF